MRAAAAPLFNREITSSASMMVANQLKAALRQLRRHKLFSVINVAGLAAGICSCLLISLYLVDELAYDRFHRDGDRVFRVVSTIQPPEGEANRLSTVPWPVGHVIEREYPEVEQLVYLRRWPSLSIRHDGRVFTESPLYAEDGFFDLFSFEMLSGSPDDALVEPYSAVLTQETARKYFGDRSPVGETLVMADTLAFTVTGVVANPEKSHIDFDLLISFPTLVDRMLPGFYDDNGWGNYNVFTYFRLRQGADPQAFEAAIEDLFARKEANMRGYETTLSLQALEDIYLRSDTGSGLGPSSDAANMYLLAIVGFFILLLAGVNFVNLATARAGDRAREIGIRKTVGSGRRQLMAQFLAESVLTCLLSTAAAFILAVALLGLFNDLAGKSFAQNDLLNTPVIGLAVAFGVVVGLAAGFYPAFVLARFQPVSVLKGRYASSREGVRLRSTLVVVQFSISCLLIIGTLIVLRQLEHMQAQDLGFDAEQVVVLNAWHVPYSDLVPRWDVLADQVESHSGVQLTSVTHAIPGKYSWNGQWAFPEGKENEGISVEYLPTDEHYVETLGLALAAGRDFSTDMRSDAENAVLINEASAVAFGWETAENAVGKFIDSPSGYPRGRVIGVVKNYHHHSLKQHIGPLVMDVNPQAARYLAVRTAPAQAAAVVDHLNRTWAELFPEYSFNTFFLDDAFDEQYRSEARLQSIFLTFAALAIFIACLGLFGLATFATTKRIKEIGVRKVFGATAASVVLLLSKDFLRLVLIAFAVSVPIAYVAGNRWLQDFAYRTDISAGVILAAGIGAAAVALVTVSYQALRAARTNPADTLRYE